jgi:hypothetical protein
VRKSTPAVAVSVALDELVGSVVNHARVLEMKNTQKIFPLHNGKEFATIKRPILDHT